MADTRKETIVGSGKVKHDSWLQATISEKNLHILLDNLSEYEGNKYAKININILNEPDRYGKNVKLSLDTWRPSGDRVSKPRTNEPIDATYTERMNQQANDESESSSTLPF